MIKEILRTFSAQQNKLAELYYQKLFTAYVNSKKKPPTLAQLLNLFVVKLPDHYCILQMLQKLPEMINDCLMNFDSYYFAFCLT